MARSKGGNPLPLVVLVLLLSLSLLWAIFEPNILTGFITYQPVAVSAFEGNQNNFTFEAYEVPTNKTSLNFTVCRAANFTTASFNVTSQTWLWKLGTLSSISTSGITSYGAYAPQLAEFGSDLYVFFYYNASGTNQLAYAKASDGGFYSANDFTSTTSLNKSFPSAAAFGSKLYVAWSEGNTTDADVFVSYTSGSNPASDLVNSLYKLRLFGVNFTSIETRPTLTNASNILYVAWQSKDASTNLNTIRYTYFTSAWSNASNTTVSVTNFTTTGNSEYPELITFNNLPYITWLSNSSTDTDLEVKVGKLTDSSSTTLTSNAVDDYGAKPIVFNSKLFVFWFYSDGSKYVINYAYSSDGATWYAAPSTISLTGQSYYFPSPFVWNSRLYLAYLNSSATASQPFSVSVRSSTNGTDWSGPLIITNSSFLDTATLAEMLQGTMAPETIVHNSYPFTLWTTNDTAASTNQYDTVAFRTLLTSLPSNITMDIGRNGTILWNYTGTFNSTDFINLTPRLQAILPACTCTGCFQLGNYTCLITTNASSITAGTLLPTNFEVNYHPLSENNSAMCQDGVDNDCDGYIDSLDADCSKSCLNDFDCYNATAWHCSYDLDHSGSWCAPTDRCAHSSSSSCSQNCIQYNASQGYNSTADPMTLTWSSPTLVDNDTENYYCQNGFWGEDPFVTGTTNFTVIWAAAGNTTGFNITLPINANVTYFSIDITGYNTTGNVWPRNITLDVGGNNDTEWLLSNVINTTNSTSNMTKFIQAFNASSIAACTCLFCNKTNSNQNCSIGMRVGSDSAGKVFASNLIIAYTIKTEDCNGIDDDNDGYMDNALGSITNYSITRSCSYGPCAGGTQTCQSNATWTTCSTASLATTETCNGIDDDCSGTVDDSLTAPACALTLGVCSGVGKICGGASGWLACNVTSYGSSYNSSGESCWDDLDNDCDGMVDEDCTLCSKGNLSIEKLTVSSNYLSLHPGDVLDTAIQVKNLNDTTFKNAIIKAWIKENITTSMSTIVQNATTEFNIAAYGAVDDRATQTLYLKIPINATTARNKTYSHILYVRAYQSTNVAGQCKETSQLINASRLNHDLAIDTYEFSPKSTDISCNDHVDLYARVWNTGLNDETDIKLNVQNSELGIDVTSGRFDLVAGDSSSIKLTFKLPDNTTKLTYPLTLRTYNENADKAKTINMQIRDCISGATVTSFYSKKYNLIEAGTPHVFVIADSSIPIYEFRYKLNSDITDGKLSIDLLTGKPAIISDPPNATVYKYLRMTMSFSSNYITYVTALFKVPDTWIKANDMDKNSIKLQRYADNTWTTLNGSFLMEEKGAIKYNSSVPAFSFFAITGTKAPTVHVCGDNACTSDENYTSCPQDCPPPVTASLCGNEVCEEDESETICPEDCAKPSVCGNGVCEKGETPENCIADCGALMAYFISAEGLKKNIGIILGFVLMVAIFFGFYYLSKPRGHGQKNKFSFGKLFQSMAPKSRKSAQGFAYTPLHSYIYNNRRIPKHHLKSALLSARWPEQMIEQAFRDLKL